MKTTEQKHTPGPWLYQPNDPDRRAAPYVRSSQLPFPGAERSAAICKICTVLPMEENRANARLIGDRNTGDCNTGSRVAGFFCAKEPCVMSFDTQTKLTFDKFLEKYPESHRLGELLMQIEPIKFAEFKRIPGITKAKLAALHKKHLEGRKIKGAP